MEQSIEEQWIEFGQDVVEANLWNEEPTLCQAFHLIEHGSFRDEE